MEFTNVFVVPADVDTTFATLTDLERVAPCLPGATLEGIGDGTYTGSVEVRVGPAQVSYRGTARLSEVDAAAKRGRIEATGQEARGSGTASATITALLTEVSEGTRVDLVTDLRLTGKVAQFGRGVLGDAGSTIVITFADRLRTMLSDLDAAEEVGEAMDARKTAGAHELLDAAKAPAPKRLVQLVIGVLVLIAVLQGRRRTSGGRPAAPQGSASKGRLRGREVRVDPIGGKG